MRRALATAACAVVAAALGCGGDGGDSGDQARQRLQQADRQLAERPRDPRALEQVIRAALAGVNENTDTSTGVASQDARPFLDRAAAVWPRYLEVTRRRPRPAVAAIMVQVYGNGLNRPPDAARAATLLTREQPTAATYLQLVLWSARAGDTRTADLAGQKALELAGPGERERVREQIRAVRQMTTP